MNDVYVGIVTYNPNLSRLKENISAIQKQVPYVLIFDNASINIDNIRKKSVEFENVILIESCDNIGIAAALNRLMQWGYDHKYNWMLSLDQDSVCPDDYVSSMKPFLAAEDNLGVVAPVIIDRNIDVVGHMPKEQYAYVNTCITSGAFSKICAWKEIGEYDESMFIDSVDFDFCYRMRKHGYGVIQVKTVQLYHELGRGIKKTFLFWKICVLNHNAFRKYYIARNNIYYPLKNKLWLHVVRGNWRNLRMILIVFWYEDNKKEKVKSILKGWKDGYIYKR